MSEIGTNKVFIWKNNLEYLDVGEIKINKTENYKDKRDVITQNLFTGLKSVDDFNENVLNQIFCYEVDGFKPRFYDLFDIIDVKDEDIKSFVISKLKWRRCSAYLVIQTSNLGYRYLCYFYDHIHHSAQCFGTSYSLVKKSEIINYFNYKLDEIKSVIDFERFPELKAPIENRDYERYFGIS